MFGSRYFGNGGTGPGAGTGASAAEIWAYTLGNGRSAAQNLIDIDAALATLLARNCFDEQIQGSYTAGDVLRILAAVAAGKTLITALGGGAATVAFSAIDDSVTTVEADMLGSERVAVTLTPTESS